MSRMPRHASSAVPPTPSGLRPRTLRALARFRSAPSRRDGRGAFAWALLLLAGVTLGASLVAAPATAARASVADRAAPALADEPGMAIYLPLSFADAGLDALPLPGPVDPATATAAPPTETPAPSATSAPTETPPPTQTSIPEVTPTPTVAPPTETPAPSPTPTEALACSEVLRNGDFEAGARNYELRVTGFEQQLTRAILLGSGTPMEPVSGRYVGFLGGLADSYFELISDRLLRVDRERVASATLRYRVALVTEERPNGRANDVASVRLVQANREQEVPGASVSEEDLRETHTWHEVEADATSFFAEGREPATGLVLRVDTDRAATSWFYFDDLSLEVCQRPARR